MPGASHAGTLRWKHARNGRGSLVSSHA